MAVKIQIRRDTAANWTSNDPTLAVGEIGYETDTSKLKFGDGTTAWTSLAYWPPSGLLDHGDLAGLADDDHTQYLNETRHDSLAADNPHSVTFTQAVTADSGTDISAAEAETLTDGSNADSLHVHAELDHSEIDDGNSGSADTIHWSAGPFHLSTLTANVTYTFTAPNVASILVLRVVQDSTARTITWPASVLWPGNVDPTLSQGSGDVDVFTFYYNGTSYYSLGVQFDLS